MKKGERNFSWMNQKLEVRDTKKYGKGVFAKENIKKGDHVWKMIGDKVSLEECWKRINSGDEDLTDPLQIALEEYLDLEDFSRLFNHNCEPNLGVKNQSDLFAIKDIEKGEELTFDYSTTVGPNIPLSEWTMVCGCDSKKCRKVIGNINSISESDLNFYKNSGFLPDYLKKYFNI